MSDSPNAGYDEWVAAIGEDAGYALVCPEGHGSLPPRRVCPNCGDDDLSEEPLPAEGTVETYTVTHVASPQFEEDAPYVTAIASFGPVSLTGQLRGVDPKTAETGLSVEVGVEERATTGDPILVFRPA